MPSRRMLKESLCSCAMSDWNIEEAEGGKPRSIFYVHEKDFDGYVDCPFTQRNKLLRSSSIVKQRRRNEKDEKCKKIYETAFDSRISKSVDLIDDIDRFASCSILNEDHNIKTSKSHEILKVSNECQLPVGFKSEFNLNGKLKGLALLAKEEDFHLDEDYVEHRDTVNKSSEVLNLNEPNVTPPSTVPLPAKFPTNHDSFKYMATSMKSVPNIAANNSLKRDAILRNLKLPVQSHITIASNSSGDFKPRCMKFSSSESVTSFSSGGGSMESFRSTESNRSTSSSETHRSTSLSSHSSDLRYNFFHQLRAPLIIDKKLNVLSPISDKSSHEPSSDTADLVITTKTEFGKLNLVESGEKGEITSFEKGDKLQRNDFKKSFPLNKNLLSLTGEIQGSDSGISVLSRDGVKSRMDLSLDLKSNFKRDDNEGFKSTWDSNKLPFDIPKLRRKKIIQTEAEICSSGGSATSIDVGELPFDIPKLRRKQQLNVFNSVSSKTGNNSDLNCISRLKSPESRHSTGGMNFRKALNLNLNFGSTNSSTENVGEGTSKSLRSGLNLFSSGIKHSYSVVDQLDVHISLDKQSWYHGAINKPEAEDVLRPLKEGSFLVRNSQSKCQDFALSLKCAKGFMHMRIRTNDDKKFMLAQCSKQFDSIPELIRHYCLNRLPIRGAEHVCLLEPVNVSLL